MCLTDLAIGQRGIITEIDKKCRNIIRLNELGFTPDAEIIPVHKSFCGSIRAYWIKGVVMALRSSEARYINVREEKL